MTPPLSFLSLGFPVNKAIGRTISEASANDIPGAINSPCLSCLFE